MSIRRQEKLKRRQNRKEIQTSSINFHQCMNKMYTVFTIKAFLDGLKTPPSLDSVGSAPALDANMILIHRESNDIPYALVLATKGNKEFEEATSDRIFQAGTLERISLDTDVLLVVAFSPYAKIYVPFGGESFLKSESMARILEALERESEMDIAPLIRKEIAKAT